MGAYSTRTITRKTAISMILSNLNDATEEEDREAGSYLSRGQDLEEATNEQLAEVLFALTMNKVLDNYHVINEDQP